MQPKSPSWTSLEGQRFGERHGPLVARSGLQGNGPTGSCCPQRVSQGSNPQARSLAAARSEDRLLRLLDLQRQGVAFLTGSG